MARNPHHHVYVVELDSKVLTEEAFRHANPDHREDKPCVYVGLTGLTPEQRFENHRRGIKAAKLVKKFGLRLRPRLYAHFNPMTYAEAVAMEKELARRLRKRGFAVWQR